uniref:BTB domain-containing protein n=1 Tax=Heterorhabditis bacteriophora TaxID=37862 RepID=A0A1I7X6F0_HETBA
MIRNGAFKDSMGLQDVTAHHATEIVHINAGGKRYSTLFETLARSKSSYFIHFVRIDDTSGKILLYHRNFIEDLSGGIFINRDGDLFGYILQYMRDGKRTVLPDDINKLKQLAREAEFFGMENLRRVILEKLDMEEKRKEEAESILLAIKNTTNQISQNLYFNGFKR